jgi:hypothetical protein
MRISVGEQKLSRETISGHCGHKFLRQGRDGPILLQNYFEHADAKD